MEPREFVLNIKQTVIIRSYDFTDSLTDEDLRKLIVASWTSLIDDFVYILKTEVESIERVE